MPDKERITYLLKRYEAGMCSPEELKELDSWYELLDIQGHERELWQKDDPETLKKVHRHYKELMGELAEQNKRGEQRPVRTMWRWMAAAVLVGISTGVYFISQKRTTSSATVVIKSDVPPGGDHATLTLANGQTILLDSAANGNLASIGAMQVIKSDSGHLTYKGIEISPSNALNTLSTPRGGRYAIQLPDGTKVWLNAATTLQFPIAFSATERRVILDGEAYFEVAHDAKRPFYVTAGGQQVKVLGTHFNINSYADEQRVSTALLQGSVQVTAGDEKAVLQPGQEAVLHNHSLIKQQANLEKAIAWKDGLLDMDGQTLEEIMRQISRWYDVEIIYQGKVPNVTLRGQMDRGLMLSDIIKGLEQLQVHCRLEGKKLIVQP